MKCFCTVLLFASLFYGSQTVAPAQSTSVYLERDIGAVAVAGSADTDGSGGFTIHASGEDIWGTADEFHFVYIQLSGDFQIVGQVTGIDFTDGWAKAGLMARETLDANSRNFMVFLTPQFISGIQWRAATGGNSTYVGGGTVAIPHWIKLVRTGNTFSGYRLADGVNWTLIGSTTLSLPSSIFVGMAVTSHHDGTLCTATFDHVTQSGGGGGGGGGTATPAPPTDLTVTGVSSTSISLAWIDNATNENVFTVERSVDGVNFQAIVVLSANSTTYTDTGLSHSTHYFYRVFASNAAGNSPRSNMAVATTASGPAVGNWLHEDIGAVNAAGSFSQNGNTYTVGGSGFDIWGNFDEFHYAYQTGTNNVQIVARITGMMNTSPWAKAGIMIRESLVVCYDVDNTCAVFETDYARNVMLALTPGHGLAFQWRPQQGGPTFYIDAGPASAPVWVKLVKTGKTFTGYRSVDGVNWTQVGSAAVDMESTSALSLGLGVTSHNDGVVCIANFDNVSLNLGTGGGGGGGGTNSVPAAPSALTATATAPDRISLTWQDNSTNETGFILERATDGTTFIQIGTFPANNQTAVEAVVPGTHHWYRVVATNSVGRSPYSNIAEATTPGGGGTGGVPAPPTDLVGTAVSQTQINLVWKDMSTNEAGFVLERSVPSGTFQQIALLGANTQSAIDTVSPGSTYWYRVAATNSAGRSLYSNIAGVSTPSLPPPWQVLGISAGGNATLANGVFSVTASSGDIYGTDDSFFFAYQPVSGDQTIIAAIDGLDLISGSLDPWARVGLMIRETLSPGAKNAMVFLSAQHGTGFTWREASFGSTQYTPGNQTARFLKLARTANTFSAYWSPDGSNWQLLGSATISMASSVYIGLAVTSHGYGSEVRGRFSQVAITSGGGGGGSGGTLPSPWQSQNVGDVGVGGSASVSQGTFTVKGSGSDIWETSDAFYFAFQDVSGDAEIIARVTGLQNTSPWAKAGVMFRQILDANRMNIGNARNVFVMTTPDQGAGMQSRTATGGGSSYVPGPFYGPPMWVRLKRQGDLFTGYSSLDGVNWTVISSQTVSFTGPVVAGLAVTSHNNSVLTTATFDNVTVVP